MALIDLERRELGTTDQFGLDDRYPHRVFPFYSKAERAALARMNNVDDVDTGHRWPSLGERAKLFAKRLLRIRRPR